MASARNGPAKPRCGVSVMSTGEWPPDGCAPSPCRTSEPSTAFSSTPLPKPAAHCADPEHLGAEIGFFAVLHTSNQSLVHPHLHCVVLGGGLSPDGKRWISCRPDFFLP